MSPILFGTGPGLRETDFYYRGDQLYAVRKGPFKAHFTTWTAYSQEEAERHDPPLLFHLGQDPAERYNVAGEHPDVIADLVALREAHVTELVPGEPQLTDGNFRGRWVR